MTKKEKENWEKEFEKRYPTTLSKMDTNMYCDIKFFFNYIRHQTIKEVIKAIEDFEDEYDSLVLPYTLYPDDIARLKSKLKELLT